MAKSFEEIYIWYDGNYVYTSTDYTAARLADHRSNLVYTINLEKLYKWLKDKDMLELTF